MPDRATLIVRFHFLLKVFPLIAFMIPFVILYFLYPASFELTWKGRTFYLFFIWLVVLEIILNWDRISGTKIQRLKSARALAFIAATALPVLYVLAANYWGLDTAILDFGRSINVSPNVLELLPLSTEYLVLTVLFIFSIAVYYGIDKLGNFSISTFFLSMIGMVYTIDNLYPWGRFTPFQILVPTTTMLAAGVLGLLGFGTSITYINSAEMGSLTRLEVKALSGKIQGFNIAWPCSGVESLLIYSVTILLFLKNSSIPWKHRIVYFVFGAAITYLINALRIATIFIIAINGGDWGVFHNYYGQLYSLFWIMSYPLIIVATRTLWGKIFTPKTGFKQDPSLPRPI